MTLAADDLALVDALHRVGVLPSDELPRVATVLLAAGIDTPSLTRLAGLDVEPFDSRDALDLLARVMEEASVEPADDPTATRWAGLLLGSADPLWAPYPA